MAIPNSGGFSAIVMLPEHVQIGSNQVNLRAAVCASYTNPKGEEIQTKFPRDHEFESKIQNFLGVPDWNSIDLNWIKLHYQLTKHAMDIEQSINPAARFFWQIEISNGGKVHVHILFISGWTSKNITWTLKRIRREICKQFSDIMGTFMSEWTSPQWWGLLTNCSMAAISLNRAYSPRLGKTIPQPVNPYSFLTNYLYNPKKSVMVRECSMNLNGVLKTDRLEDIPELVEEGEPDIRPMTLEPGDQLPLTYVSTSTDWETGGGYSTIKVGVMEKLCMEALRLCKENMIFTLKDFKLQFPEKFLQFSSRTRGTEKLSETIDLYVESICAEESAWNIAKARMKHVPEGDMDHNLVVRLVTYQGYSPMYMGQLLVSWLKDELGKKNSVYFFGPANTGKTMMAESICKMVGIYGNVNHNNVNFPFNDCHNKAIIWWEECSMQEQYVEAAKCILGGSAVRVDKKGKDSVLVQRTPVVITSNNDITVVAGRNAISSNHAAALRSRCMKFAFNNWLTSNWGLITPEEMFQFLHWADTTFSCTLTSVIAANPGCEGNIPYNQPRGNWCSSCSPQFTTKETVTLCPSCSGWTRIPSDVIGQEYDGNEVALMEGLTEGTYELGGVRGYIYP